MPRALLRHHFPHAERLVYLDHAATGPLARPVVQAVQAYLAERSEANPNNFLDVLPTLERALERAARLIGADPACVEAAPNTSYGLNVLALGYPWQAGDRVAVPRCEFPANVHPWLQLEARGVAVDWIGAPDGTFTPDDVAAALRPETRLVALSWVQFLSGFRCDLPAIVRRCHDRGVPVALDAIQGLGALRLDVAETPVDFLACGAQKWLLAMQGGAFVYVAPHLLERLTPVRGWLNGPVDWDDFGTFPAAIHPTAARFRLGTLSTAALVALDAALGLHFEAGPEAAEAQVLALARQLGEGLDALGLRRYGTAEPAHASGIVTVHHPDPEGAWAALRERGVHVSVRDRKLRFAPTWYNTAEEVDRALGAVRATLPRAA